MFIIFFQYLQDSVVKLLSVEKVFKKKGLSSKLQFDPAQPNLEAITAVVYTQVFYLFFLNIFVIVFRSKTSEENMEKELIFGESSSLKLGR